MTNLPISYDFHGDIPLKTPFESIPAQDIHIYLDVDTYIGTKTCGQTCNHCWFVNYPKVQKKAFSQEDGLNIFTSLKRHGYNVFPRYTDSFAYDGELMKVYGSASARTYFEGTDAIPTETMEKGEAWTSGKPLLNDNAEELLDLARENGYGTITMTFHGLIRDDLTLEPSADYPIKGVFSGSDFEKAVATIKSYNERKAGIAGFTGFRVGAGITVGTHNHTKAALLRYLKYFNAMGVSAVRFNRFFDHGYRHPALVLSEDQVRTFYADIKALHDTTQLNFQLGVSEDFGTSGIKAMNFPSHVGWCRAGKQLFAIIPTKETPAPMARDGEESVHIGDIVGCVNVFEPTLGAVYRHSRGAGQEPVYETVFFNEKIDAFAETRMNGTLKNGCFAREIVDMVDGKRQVIKISAAAA